MLNKRNLWYLWHEVKSFWSNITQKAKMILKNWKAWRLNEKKSVSAN